MCQRIYVFFCVIFILNILTQGGAEAGTFDHKLSVVGNVRCKDSFGHAFPAGRLIVEPVGKYGSLSVTQENNGYYELDLPFEVYDEVVLIKIWNNDKDLEVFPILLSKGDRLKRRNWGLVYISNDMNLKVRCDDIEPFDEGFFISFKERKSSVKDDRYGKYSFLYYLRLLASAVPGAPSPEEDVLITRIEKSSYPVREFESRNSKSVLDHNRTIGSQYLGFRYSLGRTSGNSILTNSSVIAFENSLELGTGVEIDDNSHLASITFRSPSLNDFYVGLGFFDYNANYDSTVLYDDGLSFEKEYSHYERISAFSLAYRLRADLAISILVKHLRQTENYPLRVDREVVYGIYSNFPEDEFIVSSDDVLIDKKLINDTVQFDFAFSWELSPKTSIGLAFINFTGQEELADGVIQSNRGVGVGVSRYYGRLQVGVDFENTEIFGFNSSLGASYKYSSDFDFSGGFITRDNTFKFSVEYKGIFLSFRHNHLESKFMTGARLVF